MPIDEKYYREISPGSMAEQLLISARNRIFQDFRAYVQPSHSDQVLDVGVSDVVNDGAQMCWSEVTRIRKISLRAD